MRADRSMDEMHRYAEEVAALLAETQEKLDSAKDALWLLRRITIGEHDGGIDAKADERS